MIKSLLLVDDESLFHLVFEDACSMLDIALHLESIASADTAEDMFRKWMIDATRKPECVFVDLNIIGSSIDGIELIRRVTQQYGHGVVIGIISSSSDSIEQQRAQNAGAQFWIVKSDAIEPRLEQFREDYEGYRTNSAPFKVYH